MMESRIEKRPWGEMEIYAEGKNFWVKGLKINPGGRISLQKHEGRGELWMCVEGIVWTQIGHDTLRKSMQPFDTKRFGAGVVHRLGSDTGGTIIEIGYGKCDEQDIERIEDDYGRN